jgi:sulfonate dioxygenase
LHPFPRALLGAHAGVIVIRDDDDFSVEDQLAFGRHFGPLHTHPTTGIPRQEGLEEVHLVYADKISRPDPTAFAKEELYHSDVTYELQPPGLVRLPLPFPIRSSIASHSSDSPYSSLSCPVQTSLKLVTVPEVGGDTIFSSGSALYSSFSPGFQSYLEGLTALHSGVGQANGSRAAGRHIRREPVESVHPVVRVHPVTGIKSIFVNPGGLLFAFVTALLHSLVVETIQF